MTYAVDDNFWGLNSIHERYVGWFRGMFWAMMILYIASCTLPVCVQAGIDPIWGVQAINGVSFSIFLCYIWGIVIRCSEPGRFASSDPADMDGVSLELRQEQSGKFLVIYFCIMGPIIGLVLCAKVIMSA